jgi:hypothetical protein
MQFPRLFTDPLDQDKATLVLQRICDRAFATPGLIYAVLYYADRQHLVHNSSTLYGETYLAYHHAAVPSWANHIYMTLCMPSRDVGLYLQLRRHFLINGEGWLINRDISARGDKGLSQAETDSIDDAVHWYRSASAREILISRRDLSWQQTPHGEPISRNDLQRHGKPPLSTAQTPVPATKLMQFSSGESQALLMAADEMTPDCEVA